MFVTIIDDESDLPTVMGRDLHEALEIKTKYADWFTRMCEYGFTENMDFMAISQKRETAQGNITTYTDHQLTIEMAKEICMIQFNVSFKAISKPYTRLSRFTR